MDRIHIKANWVEYAANPRPEVIVLFVGLVPERGKEFRITVWPTNVFRRASVFASQANR